MLLTPSRSTARSRRPTWAAAALGWLLLAGPVASAAAQGSAAAPASAPPAQTTMYPGGKWTPGPARYGFEVAKDIPVTMDDGVVLDANIAYPTDLQTGRRAEGRFPVVVEHMPYVQFAVPVSANTYFAQHGYISAQVRPRGLGKSGGEVQFLSPREGQDGKAIVEWAARRLEGSDGRVALVGCSWPGAIALTDAAHVGRNSALKAVVAACSGMDNMHRQSWLNAGMPTMSFWQFEALGPGLVGNSAAAQRYFRAFTESVMSGGDMAYDRDYWRDRGRATFAQQIVDNGVPVLLWSGWGDVVETGTLRAYIALQNAHARRPVYAPMQPRQRTTPRYQLVMGGWEHGEGLDMGLYLQWLETWVKGVDTGIQNTRTPMHVFEPGTQRWINLTGFPTVTENTPWRLAAQGGLERRGGSSAAGSGSDVLNFGDPTHPGNKLSYTTPPLQDGATISGAMSVTLFAASSTANMVLIGRLYDVAPDGSAALISRGAVLGSLRALDDAKSWRDSKGTVTWPWPRLDRDEPLVPGQVTRFDLPLAPRQWGIAPGHRVRLEITTQTPADRCPATGLPSVNDSDPCRLTGPQQASVAGGVYTLHHGAKTPSALNLPLLPYRHFREVRAGLLPAPWNEGRRSVLAADSDAPRYTLPLDWGLAR